MSMEIVLTQGKVAIVDDCDYEFLNKWKWFAAKDGKTYYAIRMIKLAGRRTSIRMHRLIIGAESSQEVDHRDRNGLNNTRKNIRICNHGQNCCNADKKKNNKYKGVRKAFHGTTYQAKIHINGKQVHIGSFKSEIDAASAYDAAAIKYFGEFANINFQDNP